MTVELIGALANIATALVVAVSAVAAVRQLRHQRNANQLQAILAVVKDFQAETLQAALRYVQVDLARRMEDPEYRAELERVGFIDPRAHPEMEVCNWFNEMGTLLKNGMVDEGTFLDLFHRLAIYYWDLLAPAVAVLRRKRSDAQYESFEYLAAAAQRWRDAHPHGTFPPNVRRMAVPDPWLSDDAAAAAPAVSAP